MLLGFSTGCLYKTHDNLAKSTFELFRNIGCEAIEIFWYKGIEEIENFKKIQAKDLIGFKYVSLHAPSFDRFTEVEIATMLNAIAEVHEQVKFDAIVLHPYETMNLDLFRQFDLPFMIENMDWRKEFGKYTESLEGIFSKFDVPMVLDINHCYTNDPTLTLANELSEKFWDRIKEIHLSGFERYHEPLFQTKQAEIIKAIPNNHLPIIIESGCETVEDVKNEFEYVKSFFVPKKVIRRLIV